jgi:hypothetical protein
MPKFQAKYEVKTDLDNIERKALASGHRVRRSGGRPEKRLEGEQDARAQVVIEIAKLQATIQISSGIILIYWPGEYQNINEIEHILEDILEPKARVYLSSLRTSIPSIIEEQMKVALLLETLELQKKSEELSIQKKELETLLEVAQERIRLNREMGIEPLQGPKPDSETNLPDREEVVQKAKQLLSTP